MKILLRSDYKWHEANFNINQHAFIVDGQSVYETAILAVKEDNRNQFATCTNCGTTIPNTSEEITKHLALHTTTETCMTCPDRRIYTNYLAKDKPEYIRNEDNTYTEISKRKAIFYCMYNRGMASEANIHNSNGMSRCKYRNCSTNTIQSYSDIFIEKPNLFDDIITVDALDKEKWIFQRKFDNYSVFNATGSIRLSAIVNNMGIVDYFSLDFRNNSYDLYYSKKYDTIYYGKYHRYTTEPPMYNISATTLNRIYKKIKELTTNE